MGLHSGLYDVQAVGLKRVIVAGGFTTVGSGNPTATTGVGATVTRAATGRYVVTLDETPNAIESVHVTVAPETPGSAAIVVIDQDTIDGDSFEVQLYTTADSSTTDFALADDVGSVIYWHVFCRNSSVDF